MTYLYGDVKKQHDYSKGSAPGVTILSENFDSYELTEDSIIKPQIRCFTAVCRKEATNILYNKELGTIYPFCTTHSVHGTRPKDKVFSIEELDFQTITNFIEEGEASK